MGSGKPVTLRAKTSRWIIGGPGVSTIASRLLAADLVRRKVAVIATNTPTAPVAKAATKIGVLVNPANPAADFRHFVLWHVTRKSTVLRNDGCCVKSMRMVIRNGQPY